MSDIFNEVKKLGIEFDSSNSDLYIPVNEQTKELVKKYFWNSEQKCLSAIVTTFHNQTSKEKELWYDLAFQFLPYWEKLLELEKNQIQERKDRGEDVSMCYAGYTGRNSNK